MAADYKSLREMMRKKDPTQSDWRLGEINGKKDYYGQFCVFCKAIRACTCRENPLADSKPRSEPCATCKPFVKSTIGSPHFRGIRDDLENLFKIPHIRMLICLLHGGIRTTGMRCFSKLLFLNKIFY